MARFKQKETNRIGRFKISLQGSLERLIRLCLTDSSQSEIVCSSRAARSSYVHKHSRLRGKSAFGPTRVLFLYEVHFKKHTDINKLNSEPAKHIEPSPIGRFNERSLLDESKNHRSILHFMLSTNKSNHSNLINDSLLN